MLVLLKYWAYRYTSPVRSTHTLAVMRIPTCDDKIQPLLRFVGDTGCPACFVKSNLQVLYTVTCTVQDLPREERREGGKQSKTKNNTPTTTIKKLLLSFKRLGTVLLTTESRRKKNQVCAFHNGSRSGKKERVWQRSQARRKKNNQTTIDHKISSRGWEDEKNPGVEIAPPALRIPRKRSSGHRGPRAHWFKLL